MPHLLRLLRETPDGVLGRLAVHRGQLGRRPHDLLHVVRAHDKGPNWHAPGELAVDRNPIRVERHGAPEILLRARALEEVRLASLRDPRGCRNVQELVRLRRRTGLARAHGGRGADRAEAHPSEKPPAAVHVEVKAIGHGALDFLIVEDFGLVENRFLGPNATQLDRRADVRAVDIEELLDLLGPLPLVLDDDLGDPLDDGPCQPQHSQVQLQELLWVIVVTADFVRRRLRALLALLLLALLEPSGGLRGGVESPHAVVAHFCARQ
mmetsp:Transcript_4643/g.13999  ORF Transcript_4643/g.13999 Transcript_4643/m.13999 type:complete len:266 (-) Transcript_4643:1553-2350(-)